MENVVLVLALLLMFYWSTHPPSREGRGRE